jgi:hypothetical protein
MGPGQASPAPASALRPIAQDVWHLVAPALRLPGGVRMPVASTVMRLPDRSLLLYSPVAFDDAMAAALAREGEVSHIVAPSLWHHLYAEAATKRFPRATLHGAPGLSSKRPDLTIHRVLGSSDPGWGDTIDVVVIDGAPKLNEAVLLHRPSGTLACADFVFNLTQPVNLMTRLLFALTGVGGGRLAQSRAWKFAVRDRAAARASIDRLLSWPIRQVAPAHGEPIAIDTATLAPVLARAYGGTARPMLSVARDG